MMIDSAASYHSTGQLAQTGLTAPPQAANLRKSAKLFCSCCYTSVGVCDNMAKLADCHLNGYVLL